MRIIQQKLNITVNHVAYDEYLFTKYHLVTLIHTVIMSVVFINKIQWKTSLISLTFRCLPVTTFLYNYALNTSMAVVPSYINVSFYCLNYKVCGNK